jgi:hypothetical protein
MISWNFRPISWSFDVSSLMILVGEDEEMNYRLSQRSLLECAAAAPVIGLQTYIRSYTLLHEINGSETYFSPYGCKAAPLRNPRLKNAIEVHKLLEDGRYSAYKIPTSSNRRHRDGHLTACHIVMWLWFLFTWIFFGSILALLLLKESTWIGFANSSILSGWSIIVRLIEYHRVRPAPGSATTRPDDPDAIFILGRSRSGFVLEGSRQDVKDWTSRGLSYHASSIIPALACQGFTRIVSSLILALIFTTIPNGSTMDQTAFILLNVIGQVNVLVGRYLNGWACLECLETLPESSENVPSRTHIWGLLLRRFKHVGRGDNAWVEAAALLPKTNAWEEWQQCVVECEDRDAKSLYNECLEREMGHKSEMD